MDASFGQTITPPQRTSSTGARERMTRLHNQLPAFSTSGSGRMPSASSLRRASSRAQVWMLEAISLKPLFCWLSHAEVWLSALSSHQRDQCIPGVRLVAVSNNREPQAAEEPPIPDRLPALVLVLLARRYAPQPAARRIVVLLVRCWARC